MADVSLLVRDATIIDGTGGPARRGSVAVDGQVVVEAGAYTEGRPGRIV
jgi:N-acyl-D-aspartate/D-glutamate deacylase